MVNHITEIIPDFDKLPDWAREAFKDGQYFTVVSEKVIAYELMEYRHECLKMMWEAEVNTYPPDTADKDIDIFIQEQESHP